MITPFDKLRNHGFKLPSGTDISKVKKEINDAAEESLKRSKKYNIFQWILVIMFFISIILFVVIIGMFTAIIFITILIQFRNRYVLKPYFDSILKYHKIPIIVGITSSIGNDYYLKSDLSGTAYI